MAGKRKRSSKSGVSGAMVLCALVIGGLASVPKGVWVFLGGALIVGIGGWLVIKAFSKPSVMSSATTMRPPQGGTRSSSSDLGISTSLTFSLDEVSPLSEPSAPAQVSASPRQVSAKRDDSGFCTVILEATERPSHRIPSAPANLNSANVRWLSAGETIEVAGENILAFLAIEPVRAEEIEFSHPYVIIEGTYLVKEDSPFRSVAELDRKGLRLAVGKGAAYDLFLSRSLTEAELVRAPTLAAAVDWFVAQQLDAAAGVRQPLEDYARANRGYRVLHDSFTEIRQAMAVPKGRLAGARFIRTFLNDKIRSGFVAEQLRQSGQQDVQVGCEVG